MATASGEDGLIRPGHPEDQFDRSRWGTPFMRDLLRGELGQPEPRECVMGCGPDGPCWFHRKPDPLDMSVRPSPYKGVVQRQVKHQARLARFLAFTERWR